LEHMHAIDLYDLARGSWRVSPDITDKSDTLRKPRISGKFGFLEVLGDELLVICHNHRLFERLKGIPSARVIEETDSRIKLVISPRDLNLAAVIIEGAVCEFPSARSRQMMTALKSQKRTKRDNLVRFNGSP
jgi:hypothetical protein